jgi:DNA-binding MarR family transcriptional regulator
MDLKTIQDNVTNIISYFKDIENNVYKKYNLTNNEALVFIKIANSEITQTEICELLNFAKSTVHSIILKFLKIDLIYILDKNKKEKYLYLTDKGKELFINLNNDLNKKRNDIYLKLSEEELKSILNISLKLFNLR